MSQFIQLHILTSYAPSNLNRDDLGRPKTAKMGGFDRLRVSSQSLKRNWRCSEVFESSLADNIGKRTKRFGQQVFDLMIKKGASDKNAKVWAADIAGVFGKIKKDSLEIEQLAHISPEEQTAAFELAAILVEEGRPAKDEEKALLRQNQSAVDIALFGRMLAASPRFNVEAACQVAHALSVHSIVVEDDYFTAVDDLNDGKEDSGSSHIGESGFAAALFYNYICINKSQLIENLDGNEVLANKAIQALTEAAVKVSPKGKQNSFASRAYASYVLAEKGEYQPRSLSAAFLKPIAGGDQAVDAIKALNKQAENFDKVYGECAEVRYVIDAVNGEGSFEELKAFVAQ